MIWRGLAALLAVAPVVRAQQSGGTVTPIENIARSKFTMNGLLDSAEARVTVFRADTAGPDDPNAGLPDNLVLSFDAAKQLSGICTDRFVLAHRLSNNGNATLTVALTLSLPARWAAAVWRDVDGDGRLGTADALVTGNLTIPGKSSVLLLVVVEPLSLNGVGEVRLTATAVGRPTVSAVVRDQISFVCPLDLGLVKRVDRTLARSGDTLAYRMVVYNRGRASASALTVLDTLPTRLRYVSGSLTRDGVALTDAVDTDAGAVAAAARSVATVKIAALAAADSTVIGLAVVVDSAIVAGPAVNRAWLLSADSTIIDATATTDLRVPSVRLTKTVTSADTVQVGGEVRYRIAYEVPVESVPLDDAVITDTLPPELALVDASPNASVQGQVLTWRVGTLAAGARGEITLRARLDRLPAGSRELVNRVTLRSLNAASASAVAAAVFAQGFGGLILSKTAGVLEARIGDAVPFTLQVTNGGTDPVRDVVLVDLLPPNTSLVRASVTGADSVRTERGRVTFVLRAPLAAQESRVIRFALVLTSAAGSGIVTNRAIATAAMNLTSDTATAWVRVQRGAGVSARVIVGKVYIDRNDNGVQDADEPGVARARVWSADGEVVTTDQEGRYSFRDVRSGTTLLRLDTLSLGEGVTLSAGVPERITVRTDGWITPRANFRLRPQSESRASAPAGMLAAFLIPASNAGGAASADLSAPLREARVLGGEVDAAILSGEALVFESPARNAIVATNRLLVRVRGLAGKTVKLFDGSREIRTGTLRPDGTEDFIAVDVTPGPHTFRAEFINDHGRAVSDSVRIHRSGDVATLMVVDSAPKVHIDAIRPTMVRVRALDEWGMPVATSPQVTLSATRAVIDASDADSSSVGQQYTVSEAGWLDLPVRALGEVGVGELRVTYGKTQRIVPLTVLPSLEPLFATAVGQVGVGASPDAFGAVTVRGTVGKETAVTVSYDSRRGNDPNAFFARGYDPLDEGRYPTLGDGSDRRVSASGSQGLSAKLERGFSSLQWGDIASSSLGGDAFGGYRRALTGLSGRLVRGALTYEGFGTMTKQGVSQRQLRGNGTSGPYVMGRDVRPGTDRVAIEVRARDNAARVLSREELARFVDYQIDYETGVVLLRRTLPSEDAFGNFVFLVTTAERAGDGTTRAVGGGRVGFDATRYVSLFRRDTTARLTMGISGARDGGSQSAGALATRMIGTDVALRVRSLEGRLNALRTTAGDSGATAFDGNLTWVAPNDKSRIQATWSQVTGGFSAAFDPRLSQAAREISFAAETQIRDSLRLKLSHQRQEFGGYGVTRNTTTLRGEEQWNGHTLSQELALAQDAQRADSATYSSTSLFGKASIDVNARMQVWAEGNRVMGSPAAGTSRPNQIGAGVRYVVLPGTSLEGTQRWVEGPGGLNTYAVSSLNLRTTKLLGGDVWGGLERSASESDGDARAVHSAVLGWTQRWSLHGGWNANTSFERRVGLSRASLVDPVRALPFAQLEPNRWSSSGGLEWLPGEDRPRLSARGELFGGTERRGHRLVLSGDAALGNGKALLTLHDWSSDRMLFATGRGHTRRDRSLLGLAMRPTEGDEFNALMKLEWRRTALPLASGIADAGARDERVIASFDGVWTPNAKWEVDTRYATRWARTNPFEGGAEPLSSRAHYLGARADRTLPFRLRARLDARALVDRSGRTNRWNLAPAGVVSLTSAIEFEAGYRFGDLRDRDFASNGGHGAYALLGVNLTESALRRGVAMWRARVANER